MFHRIAPMVCAAVLVLATSAWAQSEIRGVVSSIDPATRTVYFTDGRIVQLKAGSTLLINGQPVVLESIRPGSTLVMLQPGSTTTTVTTVTQQSQIAAQPVPAQPAPAPAPPASPINVTGTVARVDPMSQTLTFQDGRVVKVTGQTVVWQQAPAISSLQPGTQVFVSNATPIGYLPSAPVSTLPSNQWLMGTVSRVEPASQQIVLSDGTIVHVGPAGTVRVGNERVAFSRLRPGDEIVIQRRPVVVTPTPATTYVAPGSVTVTTAPSSVNRYEGSALPYQGYADSRIEASDVMIMWSSQAR